MNTSCRSPHSPTPTWSTSRTERWFRRASTSTSIARNPSIIRISNTMLRVVILQLGVSITHHRFTWKWRRLLRRWIRGPQVRATIIKKRVTRGLRRRKRLRIMRVPNKLRTRNSNSNKYQTKRPYWVTWGLTWKFMGTTSHLTVTPITSEVKKRCTHSWKKSKKEERWCLSKLRRAKRQRTTPKRSRQPITWCRCSSNSRTSKYSTKSWWLSSHPKYTKRSLQ